MAGIVFGMVNKIKSIPLWGWVAGFCVFLAQATAYYLSDTISRLLGTGMNVWCPKIDAIDNHIVIVPAFSIIYVFAYLFWICGPAVISLTDRENFINSIIGWLLSYAVGIVFLVLFPSSMDRVSEGLLVYGTKKDLLCKLMYTIYQYDGLEKAINLCPSFHCISSVCCYLGIRKQSAISKGFRIYTLIMATLICLSTVFIKQHYFIDVLGGIIIPIVCFLFVHEINPGKKIVAGKRIS